MSNKNNQDNSERLPKISWYIRKSDNDLFPT